jgi:YVTN family beta-propeller protein
MIKILTGLCVCLVFGGFAHSAPGEECLSPLALAVGKDGRNVYIAEFSAKRVAVLDVVEGKAKKAFSVPDHPTGLAISPDGSSLYITCESPAGKVHFMDPNAGNITISVSVDHTPNAPVASPNGKTLYVCNRFNNDVSVIDLASKKEVARVPVMREPVAAAVTPDGKLLLVANLLPAGAADAVFTGAVVSVVDTAANKVTADIRLPNGSTGLRGICVSPDGRHAYATHILARYQLPTTQLERGWMNTNALSIIDVRNQSLIDTVLLDDVDLGAANPWGVVCTPDGKYICVSHAGTHEISIINRARLHDKLDEAGSSPGSSGYGASSSSDVRNNLAFLVGLRRRVKLAGNGPRGLAVVGTRVYAAEYFTDSLGVVDIGRGTPPAAQSIPLGPKTPLTLVRKGEMLFNDASLCFQNWQSCASCHPGGGRADALNWDLMNDGIGNPKNTRSLLLSHETPPAMMTGVRESAEAAVRAGIRHIQFVVRPEEDAVAIDEYLKSLEPVPSPYLLDGRLSKAAERGRDVFEKADCASCHPAPLYTDLKGYDVGTGKALEKNRVFDTPTLVEVWRTAPYLYDGRTVTMRDVLIKHNPGDEHGVTSGLTEQEIDDLNEFILSQ